MFHPYFKMLIYLRKAAISPVVQVLAGLLLILMGAQIAIPFYTVPFTLETLSVYFIALSFPKKTAILAVLSFLCFESFNVSAFSGFKPSFLGITYGYLVGFVLCTAVITYLRDKINPIKACILGSAVLFLCGILWLSTFIGLEKAILTGYIPFIITDFAKILFASYCASIVKNA